MADSNYFLSTYGAGEPADAPAPAPGAAAPAQGAPPQDAPAKAEPKSTGNYFSDTYGPGEGPPPETAPPPSNEPKPHEYAFLKGFVGQSNRLLTLLKRTAGQSGAGLAAEADPANTDIPAVQDEWYKRFVEPSVQDQALYDLPKDAGFVDRAFHGLGTTAGMIAQAIASGAAAGAATVEALGGGGVVARAAGGAVTMQLPAVTAAVEVGHQVLAETGDKHAAVTAGVTSYLVNSASGAVPMGVSGRLATRVTTAAGAGVGLHEAGRIAQNAAMPENMQEQFDPKEDALAAIMTAPFGIMGHPTAPRSVVEGGPTNAMERAQQHAAEAAKAQGEDELGQTVAAAQVNAEIGAHHDAAAVHAAREAEQLADSMETRRQQAEQADADNQADIDQGAREQGLNKAATEAAKVGPETTPEQGFAQREQEVAKQKEADYSAAKNQQGEQAVEASKTEDIGAAKGGANEPKPTLAEALPPEQLAALQGLKARRAAEAAKAEPAPAPTVAERLEAQNPEDSFQRLGPEVPPKAPKPLEGAVKGTPDSSRELSRPPTEAQEPLSEAEAPETNPPPVTAQTLSERRQAALDAKMAEKVRGEQPKPVEEAPVGQPKPVAEPNRLATIRAAAEKRQRPPLRQEYDPADDLLQEKVRQDSENGARAREAEKAAIPTTDRARNKQRLEVLREEYNEGRITKEAYDAARTGAPAEKASSFSARRAENAPEKAPENEWFKDLQSRLAMSHDEAKGHLAPVSDAAAPRSFQVHESVHADSVPTELKSQIDAHYLKGGSSVKGAYDAGVVHIFAGAHEAGDREELLSTAVHELTHKGLDSFLGLKHQNVMLQIAQDIKNTQWAKEYAARRGWDLGNPWHLSRLADEYSAHMAENVAAGRAVHEGLPVTDSAPSHWQRIVDSVRAGLRKIGLVKHWNDNDIAALIRQAQSHVGADPMRAAREGAAYKDSGGARFSLDNDDKYMEDHYPPDHPLAVGHKFGRTMEEQAKYNPGFIRNVKDTLSDFRDSAPRKILGAVGLRNLPDFISPEKMPSLHGFIDVHDAMEGRKGQLHTQDLGLAKDWSQWQAKQADKGESLSDLMHAATLSGHDPSKPYEERHTAEERALDPETAKDERYQRGMHKSLVDDYNKLDDKGKDIFNRVRDNYAQKRVQVLDALNRRIEETGADAQTKKNLMSQLRKTFEAGTVKGPYFPLQRFGDLWANAKDDQGNTKAFARFESGAKQKAWLAEMRKQGLTVDAGRRMDTNSMMERIDPEFVKNVVGMAHDADPSGDLEKEIWTAYLKAMPEMSMRKHMIARVGRLGFSQDALRAFAFNSFHGAHQLARLEYGSRLDAKAAGAETEARALEQHAAMNPSDKTAQSDGRWAPALAQELKDRYEWLKNPRAAAWASNVTRFGFAWYLGAAPATAVRIFTQNPMIAAPVLAKKFGWMGTTRELSRATAQWAKSYGSLGDTLRGDERRMFDEADDRGVFTNTNTQTLASGGEGSPIDKGYYHQFQKYAGFLFNSMEQHNRTTTALASYRLGRLQGLSHDEASRGARDDAWTSHFDYTNANRPRYLQSNTAKVIGLFKQYSLGVSYRLLREGADMVNSEKDPHERLIAAQALGGLVGRMMLFAGVTGMPLYWVAEKIANTILGTEDQPYDMTAALHKHLNDSLGTTAGDAIMTGPVGAISGASLSGGSSYNDLWYRPPSRDESAHQQMFDGLGQLLGPIAAIPLNAASGIDMWQKGNQERGLEHFLPPEAAALAKTVRYATQGATNMQGEPVIPRDQITDRDLFLQAIGFTPQKIADAMHRNAAIKNIDKAITDRRQLLSNKLELAYLNGDQKAVDALMPQIQAFNKANPRLAIGRGIVSGIVSKAKQAATAVNGVNVARGNEHLQQEY